MLADLGGLTQSGRDDRGVAVRIQCGRERLRSQGKNTPFLGRELAGEVRYTLIDGHLAYSADKLL